jgi:hypothetical protein
MNRADFISQFSALGFTVTEVTVENTRKFIEFPYSIPVGKFTGKEIKLSFEVAGDAPINCPGGPHISPRLLPNNNSSTVHPHGGVHDSPRGPDWQYWSRPFPNWKDGERAAKRYMAHIVNLFNTQ